MKKAFYALAATALLGLNNVSAINFWEGNVQWGLKGSDNTADIAIQNIISNIMVFLAIVAVAIMLWGGFNILTAAWDEEKVKKGKTILIQAGLGLVVIFLANSIIQWLLGIFIGA